MSRLHGACLCGAVRFEYEGPIHSLQACHCQRCRKFYGTAFGPIAVVDRGGFTYTQGEDHVRAYASSENVNRYFCRTCGSPLPIVEAWDPRVGVPLGLVDGDLGRVIDTHVFVGSKACWHRITGDGVQHEAWPPGEDMDARRRDLAE